MVWCGVVWCVVVCVCVVWCGVCVCVCGVCVCGVVYGGETQQNRFLFIDRTWFNLENEVYELV